MASNVETLLVSLEARISSYEREMKRAVGISNRSAKGIESRFAAMNRNISTNFSGLGRTIAGAFAGAAALRGAQTLIDASTRIENALKVAGLSGQALTDVYDELFTSAQRNAAPLEALVDLYGRASLVQKELGVSTEELLGFTDKVAVALRVSGKSAAESSGALLQLSQALGGGVVRAEEFNSILEGALPIAQAAAAGLEEAGGSVAKLRQLVVDGKVSSEAFFRAFEAGSSILTDKVAGAELTVSQGFIRLQNVLIDTAGKFDNAYGASESAAAGLDRLATAIQNVADYFERNAGRIKPFFDAIAAADSFDPVAFREKLGLGVIDDFLEGTSLIEGRFGLASQQIAQDAGDIEAALLDAVAAMVGLDNAAAFSPEQLATFQALIAQMEAGEAGADELRAALAEMGLTPVNFMIAFSGLSDLIDKLRETRGEAMATAAAVATAAGQNAQTNISGQRAEQMANRPKPAVTPVTLKDYKIPGGGGGGSSPGEKFSDLLDKQAEENRLLAEKTALQASLNPLVNDYGFALEKLNVQQELQTAATAAGLELTPELKAQIDELAAGYATASVEAAKLAESQDQVKQIADDFGNAGKSALSGFISDLRNGTDAATALGNAMNKILDSVIDIGLNMIFGGGGLGGIGKLFGFSGGGYTGNGGKYQPAGVVHRGEYVFTKAQTERLGVGNLSRLARGYADGGLVGAPALSATSRSPAPAGNTTIVVQLSPDLEARILEQAAGQSVQIAGQQIKSNNRQLPNLMQEVQMRHG